MRKEQGLPTYTAFLDIAKAYDRVWQPGLWVKLQRLGMDTQLLELIRLMYRSIVRRVLIRNDVSAEFEVHAGVPQGAVLSPLLYANYINGLHDVLRKRGIGVWVYGRLVPVLMYADDLTLLATDQAMLSASLLAVEEYAANWRFEFNHDKSKGVVFGSMNLHAAARLCE